MKTQKSFFTLPLTIGLVVLLAAGCNSNDNTLQRPVGEENSTNDSGEVAGTETLALTKKNITVGSSTVEVEVADNNVSRSNGLSNYKSLKTGKGMLFDFTNSNTTKPGFWMKDMFISIDMIWIHNGKIIGITPNVPPAPENTNLEIYYPPSDITHVLEVPTGWSQRANVKVGDEVKL